MLVLSRNVGEVIHIGDSIEVVVAKIYCDHDDHRKPKVRLGITAPPETPIHRREIYDDIHGITRNAEEKTNTN